MDLIFFIQLDQYVTASVDKISLMYNMRGFAIELLHIL